MGKRKQIVIVGGGFAGRAAAAQLAGALAHQDGHEIILFDKNPHTTMIPALPDLAGTRLAAPFLTAALPGLLPPAVTFRQAEVTAVDLPARTVTADGQVCPYDHLILAAGSVVNYYGFNQNLARLYKLDCLADALRISADFPPWAGRGGDRCAIVVGGGYTGIEVACNLRHLANKLGVPVRVIILEKGREILAFMPPPFIAKVRAILARQRLEVITGTGVKTFTGSEVTLETGERFADAFLVWCAGSTLALGTLRGTVERIGDGRLKVNLCLQLPAHPEVFAAGDSAAIMHAGTPLRKAVNFAIYSGKKAGDNVARQIHGYAPSPFQPFDPGWVVPFCGVGVGQLFGRIAINGSLALRLHYLMCGFRNFNARNALHFYRRALVPGECAQ